MDYPYFCNAFYFNIVMTTRQLVYMVLDELKGMSDDFSYTQEHIVFLAGNYRAQLLHQKYAGTNIPVPESNYSNICLKLEEAPMIIGNPCEGSYLRSTEKIPFVLKGFYPIIYPTDYYRGTNITYVSRDRMRFVGNNKWMQNIIYCSIGADNYLYLKSSNPQYKYMEEIKMSAVFEDITLSLRLSCNEDECDIMDKTFPIEDSLVPVLINLIVKELKSAEYSPEDTENNSSDDLANLIAFMRRNVKSNLQKQIEE